MKWLLDNDTFRAIHSAKASGRVFTHAEIEAHAQAFAADTQDAPRIYSVEGTTAVINIQGVLTDTPDMFAQWFGGGNTTYGEIVQSVRTAEADPSIKNIEPRVQSGGGHASAAWVDAMDAIKNAKKPVNAIVGSLAASAAYGLVSQSDTISAQNRLSRVGSVGVVQTMYVDDSVVEVTSSNAPNKRPDPTTEEGAKAIRAQIDPIEDIFVQAIADGRSVSADTVRSEFGKGGMFLADEAISRGMIDDYIATETTPAEGGTNTGAIKMDLTTLKNEHPSVFAEAVQAGVKQERDRVSAHLIKGESAQAMDVALESIKAGDLSTDPVIDAKYFAAAQNARDVTNRSDDDADLDAATKGVSTKTKESQADIVCGLVFDKLGLE